MTKPSPSLNRYAVLVSGSIVAGLLLAFAIVFIK